MFFNITRFLRGLAIFTVTLFLDLFDLTFHTWYGCSHKWDAGEDIMRT